MFIVVIGSLALWWWLIGFSRKLPPGYPEPPSNLGSSELRDLVARRDRECRSDPDAPEKLARLGLVYQANLLFEQARAAYQIAVGLEPSNYLWHYYLARLEEELGNQDRFFTRLQSVNQMNPDHRVAACELADACLKRGELERARALYMRLYDQDNSFLPAVLGLARVAMRQNEWQSVVNYLQPVVEQNARLRPAYQMLAAAYEALGQGDRAREAEEVLSRSGLLNRVPLPDEFREELDSLCALPTPLLKLASAAESSQNFEAMLALSRRAVRAGPKDADALYFLARALVLARGRDPAAIREAISLRNAAVQLQPDYPNPLLMLGQTLISQGRLTDAIDTLRLVLDRYPKSEEAHTNLGIALAGEAKWSEAKAHFSKALRIDPDLAPALNNLGLVLIEQGQIDQAIVCYRRALRIDPNYADAHNNLGMVLGRQGNDREAANHFQAAIRLNPDHFRAHFNLGVLMAQLGNVDAAIDCFSTVLRINPDFAEARTNLEALLRSTSEITH